MTNQKLVDKNEIVKASQEILVGDRLVVNDRNRYLDVVEKYRYYKDNYEIKEFFILEGNGTKYLFVIYRTTWPLIYSASNFSLEEKEYTDGYGFNTTSKSSERVIELFISSLNHCDDCNCLKLHDDHKEEYYCPKCEV